MRSFMIYIFKQHQACLVIVFVLVAMEEETSIIFLKIHQNA